MNPDAGTIIVHGSLPLLSRSTTFRDALVRDTGRSDRGGERCVSSRQWQQWAVRNPSTRVVVCFKYVCGGPDSLKPLSSRIMHVNLFSGFRSDLPAISTAARGSFRDQGRGSQTSIWIPYRVSRLQRHIGSAFGWIVSSMQECAGGSCQVLQRPPKTRNAEKKSFLGGGPGREANSETDTVESCRSRWADGSLCTLYVVIGFSIV